MTTIERAIAHIKSNPGLTAGEVSKAIGVERRQNGYGTVSSALCKAADKGLIRREEGPSHFAGKTAWRYYPA